MTRVQTKTQQITQIPNKERKGFSWSMNEINRLHNEYELKELSVYQIAQLHKRGVSAILHKLASENLISASWKDARGWTFPNALESSEKKAPIKKCANKKQMKLEIDKDHDYTISDSDSYSVSEDDNDEEYTLEDAQEDFGAYSNKQKIEFFKSIIPVCIAR